MQPQSLSAQNGKRFPDLKSRWPNAREAVEAWGFSPTKQDKRREAFRPGLSIGTEVPQESCFDPETALAPDAREAVEAWGFSPTKTGRKREAFRPGLFTANESRAEAGTTRTARMTSARMYCQGYSPRTPMATK